MSNDELLATIFVCVILLLIILSTFCRNNKQNNIVYVV